MKRTFPSVAMMALVACGGAGGAGGGTSSPAKSSPAVAITRSTGHEICRALHPEGKTAALRASFAAEHGCFRHALDILASMSPAASPKEKAHAAIVRAETMSLASLEGYSPLAPEVEPRFPTWTPSLEALGEAATPLEQRVLDISEVGTERVPTLAVRATPAQVCTSSKPQDFGPAPQLRLGIFTKYGQPSAMRMTPFDRHAHGLNALWECDRAKAASLFEAASTELKAGNPEAAENAKIDALEVAVFPEGRAWASDGMLNEDNDLAKRAAEDEAALSEAGSRFQAGKDIDAKLRSLESQLTTPAARARLLALRGYVALRYLAQPKAALDYAARGEAAARTAKRADLLDANLFVLLFATVEIDQSNASVKDLARAMAESMKQRAAIGESAMIAQQWGAVALTRAFQGKPDTAAAMVEVIRPLDVSLTTDRQIQLAVAVRGTYARLGRFEEAADLDEHVLANFEAHKQDLPPQVVDAYRSILQNNRRLDLGALGLGHLTNESGDQDPTGAAMDQGDDRALANLLAGHAGDETDAMRVVISMGGCAAVGTPRLRSNAASFESWVRAKRGDPAQDVRVASSAMNMVQAFGRCAAVLHDETLAAQNARIVEATTSGRSGLDLSTVNALVKADALAAANSPAAYDAYITAGRNYSSSAGGGAGATGSAVIAEVFYQRAALVALRRAPADVARAIAAIEMGRGVELRALRSTSSQRGGESFESVAAIERQIGQASGRVRALTTLAAASTDRAVADALRKQRSALEASLTSLERQRDEAARKVQARDAAAFRRASLAAPPTLTDLQARLEADEAIVYLVVDFDEAYAIVIDKKSAAATRLQAVDEKGTPVLRAALHRFDGALQARTKSGRGLVLEGGRVAPASPSQPRAEPLSSLAEAARAVSGYIMPQIVALVPPRRRVVVVPDGATGAFPFAALSADGAPWPRRNPLRIMPTGALLGSSSAADMRKTTAPGSSVVVLGDPDFGNRDRSASSRGMGAKGIWTQLPGTRREAEVVSRVHGATPLVGAAATEEALRARLASASLIHIATHGYADERRPEYGALVLSKPASGSQDDGLLHGYEIERQKLSASLVILSACETGRGQVRGGQGILALDRAFLVAGAKGTISSLWVVDDESTSVLMKTLHESLKAGERADAALAKAMTQVASRGEWTDPYYWAAFRLMGEAPKL